MTIKIGYIAEVDRIRLIIKKEGQEDCIFWLCRNQCLGLLAKLNQILLSTIMKKPDQQELMEPRLQIRKEEQLVTKKPELLRAINVVLENNHAKISFTYQSKVLNIIIKLQGLYQLKEMLVTQADRAGWDPEAGLRRLKAMVEANAAITRSIKSSI